MPETARIQEKDLWKLEVLFNPIFPVNTTANNENSVKQRRFLKMVLSHFYYSQSKHSNHRWYQDLVKRLMNNPLFRDLWVEVQQMPMGEMNEIENFTNKDFFTTPDGKQLHFYYFALPAFKDPRFLIEMHVPADRETFEYLDSMSGKK